MSETLPAEKIGAFHWVKLALTSVTTIKWLIVLLIGGAATNSDVQGLAKDILPSWGQTETLPIPDGQLTTPTIDATADSFRAQVRQSLAAMNKAINTNTAKNAALEKRVDSTDNRIDQAEATNFSPAEISNIRELVN